MAEHIYAHIKAENGFIGINRLEGETLGDILAKLKIPFSKSELQPKWIIGPFIFANCLYTYQKDGEMRYAVEVMDKHPNQEIYTVSIIVSKYPDRKCFIEMVQAISLFP